MDCVEDCDCIDLTVVIVVIMRGLCVSLNRQPRHVQGKKGAKARKPRKQGEAGEAGVQAEGKGAFFVFN